MNDKKYLYLKLLKMSTCFTKNFSSGSFLILTSQKNDLNSLTCWLTFSKMNLSTSMTKFLTVGEILEKYICLILWDRLSKEHWILEQTLITPLRLQHLKTLSLFTKVKWEKTTNAMDLAGIFLSLMAPYMKDTAKMACKMGTGD